MRLLLALSIALSTLFMGGVSRTEAVGDTFCTYTVSVTILNDVVGDTLDTFWVGMQFYPGSIVNGVVSTGVTFTDDFEANIPQNAQATDDTVAVANSAPAGITWAAFYNGLFSQANATLISGPTLTVTDCYTVSEPAPIPAPVSIPTLPPPTPLTSTGVTIANVLILPTSTGSGLQVFETDPETGNQVSVFNFSAQYISNLPTAPAVNTLITTSPSGNIRFFVLTTGELQFNIGPDATGLERVIIFNRELQITKTYQFR